MKTDPEKVYKGDPGHPDICAVYALHKIYSGDTTEIEKNCKSGELGCADCKKKLTENMNSALEGVRDRRKELENNIDYVIQTLDKGATEAKAKAASTMDDVRNAMNLKRNNA
jgi:tryptophanyl-tRNA synthetase